MNESADDKRYLTGTYQPPGARERMRALLECGEVELQGLVPWSSNYTYVATVKQDDAEELAVYKPQCGERPLWDFETGSLCKREVAAYELSAFLQFPNIPVTVLREKAPQGIGMLQHFVDHKRRENFFTARNRCREEMQKIAVFDALVNNTDRKGGHVLVDHQGGIWAIDHGVTFHEEPKLRTVIWDFVDEPIPEPLLKQLDKLRTALKGGSPLRATLDPLLARSEMRALNARLNELVRTRIFPAPPEDWPHIPWPPV